MKTRYNWETDEDRWEDLSSNEAPTRAKNNQRLTLFLLFGLTAVSFLLIFFLFNRRLQSRENAVISSVIAAHQTWGRAVAEDDLELFTSLLARDDMQWFQAQRRLFMAGQISRREPFGLTLLTDTTSSPLVNLDENWRRAEVSYRQEYSTGGSNGPLSLLHTQVYQLRGARWVSANPKAEFWGEIVTHEGQRVTVSHPSRDEVFIERLTSDLSNEINDICADQLRDGRPAALECTSDYLLPIEFSTSPDSLLALSTLDNPVMRGRVFVLPAPSIVGIPEDEAAYQALYRGYTERILSVVRNRLNSPVSLPAQDIIALCFPSFDRGLILYTMNPESEIWSPLLSDQRYRYLQPLPDDSGVILRGGFPGTEIGRLQLFLYRSGVTTPLYDEGTTELSARLVGIPPRPQSESLLISSTQGSTGLGSYRLLTLSSCSDGGCDVSELDGYPLWSPDGERTMILKGGELYLGDESGSPQESIGRAFSPFWITNNLFGFVRLLGSATAESPDMEIVLRDVDGEEKPLTRSAELFKLVNTSTSTARFRFKYIIASPTNPKVLYLGATPVAGHSEQFYILELHLEGDIEGRLDATELSSVETALVLEDLPVGDPAVLTPTGYPPFSITNDGRWLVAARFVDPITNKWVIDLYDTRQERTQTLTVNYPAYPAPFPFYDWSEDGQWLLLVDNGFFRLVAPETGYERVIPHEFFACRYPAWIDR